MVPPLFLANILGWIVAYKRAILIGLAIFAFVVFSVMVYRGCSSRGAKLNEAEIQRGQQAVKDANDKELREILAASDAREAVIDSTVANAERDKVNAIHESRKKWEAANREELQAEFDRRAKGQ